MRCKLSAAFNANRLLKSSMVLGAALFFSGLAQADIYDMTFRRVTRTDLAACQVIADGIADQLKAQASVTVIDSGCREGDLTLDGLEAVITYEAPARITLTSTYTYPFHSMSFYANVADCQAQLETQKSLFTTATGLQPLYAYCMFDGGLDHRWMTRVEAIGTSEIKPYSDSINIDGQIDDSQKLLADLKVSAAARDISIFESGVVRGGIAYEYVVRYYASKNYRLDDNRDLSFATLASCSQTASEVRQFLASASQPVTIFCESSRSGQVIMHASVFVDIEQSNDVFKVRKLTGVYPNIAACNGAAQQISTDSADIFGAVCSGRGQSFSVHLFTTP